MNAPSPAGRRRRPLRIGITGPIGCGKSTVAGWLAAAGGLVIDADALAHQVTAHGAATLPAVRGRFGDAVFRPDGSLDRAALASVVFADPAALRDLEAIVQPAVRRRIEAALADAGRRGVGFVVIEAIALVDGGLAATCDEVWLVTCYPAVQWERLRARGQTGADAQRRIAAQAGLVARARPLAARVIEASGSVEATRNATLGALREALAGAERRSGHPGAVTGG